MPLRRKTSRPASISPGELNFNAHIDDLPSSPTPSSSRQATVLAPALKRRAKSTTAARSVVSFDDTATVFLHAPVVDDEPQVRRLTRRSTSISGVQASTASSTALIPSSQGLELESRLREGTSDTEDSDSSGEFVDDPKDLDYVEPKTRRVPTVAGLTKSISRPSPHKRKADKSSVRSYVKVLIVKLDPNGGTCLVTRAKEPGSALQGCHLIARRTEDGVLTALEWYWQMPYYTLYIDTRFNIIILRADWHISMDNDDWTLVPHHRHIAHIEAWNAKVLASDYNEEKRVEISESYEGQQVFEYYILPLKKGMEKVAIHRYTVADDPRAMEAHSSHCHPHFVIYSAGQKITEQMNAEDEDEQEVFDQLASMASFGHKGDAAQILLSNQDSINQLVFMYKLWSDLEPVPKTLAENEWRYHDDAPLA
ncbi:hypothetical protein GGX14DRAFT_400244 [Mycena pura]|uniref:HNH nuclease domain-containing protein n=1 Tax=Mycena pura TaxID=153505 RepID=A0AAD6V2V2_9AGAR|nr:hypothetical protein GGX14DRAFT_400244 [Mycena pura]